MVRRTDSLVKELVSECRGDRENDCAPAERQGDQRFAECRYHGQGFALRADVPEGEVTAAAVNRIIESFHAQHHLDYGYAFDDGEVALITVRVIGTEKVKPLVVTRIERANGSGIDNAYLYSRPTTFGDGRTVDTPRYHRLQLTAGRRIPSPAVLIPYNSTILVPPAYLCEGSSHGSLLIRRSGQ